MTEKFWRFPENFLWGASTSAHQVEGNNRSDWTDWETANAERLASEAAQKFSYLSNWSDIAGQAQSPANYRSGRACDHFQRYESDFELMQSLGMTAYRFSVEWSRIQPEPDRFDQTALKHYGQMLDSMRRHGLTPLLTLWHWTLPGWVRDQGGWTSAKTVKDFQVYADRLASEFPQIKLWLTLNEPEIYAKEGYWTGSWPPSQHRKLIGLGQTLRHLAAAHRSAYRSIKRHIPDAQVGLAKNFVYYEAARPTLRNRIIKREFNWAVNNFFMNRVSGYQDLIGLNYYHHNRIDRRTGQNLNQRVSDLGWELYPQGIYNVLLDLKRWNRPIFITENGLADAKDAQRIWFIEETLRAVHQAIDAGIDVRGYLHWSLMDNFEWDKGFWPRFGLVEVDYKTMARTIRPSARRYAEIIKANGLKGR